MGSGDRSAERNLPAVKSKSDLFSLCFLAEQCVIEKDFTKAGRYLEIIKDISQTQPQFTDVDWNSEEIKNMVTKCTSDLAKVYYELKCYKHIVPLLENSIWDGTKIEQCFFDDSILLIKAYVHLEEYISAHAVASLVQKHLFVYEFQDREDEVKVLLTLIDAFLKGGRTRLENVTHLCDRVLLLTRDSGHVKERIAAFLAKATTALATVSSTSALVFSDQAVALSQSSETIDHLLVAKSKISSVEIRIFEQKYANALAILSELEHLARSDSSTSNSLAADKITMARIKYLIGLCALKLHGVDDAAPCREEYCAKLQKGAKLALSSKTTEEQSLLISIWELLAEIYHAQPDFVQMEHGHKCMLQILSNGIAKLLALVDACEPVTDSLISVISKSSRLYLEFECSLTDPKMTIETVEWVRNSIILSKIPCRRLASKLTKPLTYSWIEQLIGRYDKRSLFLYFADVGRDSSRSLCTWVLVPGQGCVFFSKSSTASTKSGKSLSDLVSSCLHVNSQNKYTSERRLLPLHYIGNQPSSSTATTFDDRNSVIAQIGETLFSRLSPHLWKDVEDLFIFPDGPLLALTSFFDELVNHWLRVSLPEPPAFPKKVYTLPSVLFLEICLENQIATLGYEEEHVKTLMASKLGGMHQYFQNQRIQSNSEIAKPIIPAELRRSADEAMLTRPLVRPQSAKLASGVHTIATLTTKSSSGGDVCTSSLYPIASSNDCILSNKAAFFGNPSIPADGIPINGTIWRPHTLISSQKEILQLSKQIYSPYFFLGPQCTKKLFLECCHELTLLHLATYVSYCDGVIMFSYSSEDAISKSSAASENIFSPLDVSGTKFVSTEIACLPLRRAKLVVLSVCQSAVELEQTIEFSRNHIGNSVYILPAAFLLAGAHAVVIPRLGLTDKQLIDGFSKLYAKNRLGSRGSENEDNNNNKIETPPNEQEYFCSTIGVNSLLDMKRLAHGMLDQEIQRAITKAKQARENLVENEVFAADLDEPGLADSRWFAKIRQLICWLAKNCPTPEDLYLLRKVIENPPKSNEMGQLPQTPKLQSFLKWLGFHVVAIDKQLTMLFSPLQNSKKLVDKVLLLLDVLNELLFGDIVLTDAAIDLLENLTIDQTFDFISFFSVVKHTSFAVQITDKTAAKLFNNPRFSSFLYLVGFFNVRNSVIFRASAGNCKRLDVVFKLFTALSYSVPTEILFKFLPLEDQAESTSAADVAVISSNANAPNLLRSLNYIVAQGPTMATNKNDNEMVSPRRIIAAEPIFHLQNNELSKAELDTKVSLANEISANFRASQEQIKAAKGVFVEQLNSFDKMASTIMNREIYKLPNRKTTDRIKVEPGGTPSQLRHPVGYMPPVSTSVVNDERGKLKNYFGKTTNAIASSRRLEIEKLIEKYAVKGTAGSSGQNQPVSSSTQHA